MKKKLLFVFNPKSGKGLIKDHLVNIVDIMTKAGYMITIYPTQSQGDAIRKVRKKAKKYDLVVCCGGDGTLDEVVTGMEQSEVNVPIGYIPAGSTNDFANSLGIPKDMEKAAETAVLGNPFPCDVGSFNNDTFVYVAAFGLFTEVSYQMKNILGHAAYILEGAKHIMDITSYRMKVMHDDEEIEDEFIYGMVTNSLSVGGFKGISGPDVLLDDGLFEVTLIKMPKNPIELNKILGGLTNRENDNELIYSFKTNELHITSDEEVPWTLDGEFGGAHSDLTIKNLNKQITIMC